MSGVSPPPLEHIEPLCHTILHRSLRINLRHQAACLGSSHCASTSAGLMFRRDLVQNLNVRHARGAKTARRVSPRHILFAPFPPTYDLASVPSRRLRIVAAARRSCMASVSREGSGRDPPLRSKYCRHIRAGNPDSRAASSAKACDCRRWAPHIFPVRHSRGSHPQSLLPNPDKFFLVIQYLDADL